MQTKFKVIFRNRELGPLAESQIHKMIAAKQLLPTDKYFDEAKADWVPLSERFLEPQGEEPVLEKTQTGIFPRAPQEESEKSDISDFEVVELGQTPPRPLKVATTPFHPEPEKASTEKIQFSSGVGTLSLKHVKAGKVNLKLKSQSGLDLPTDISMIVHSAPATHVKLEAPRDCKAGEKISIEIRAFDAFENLAADFSSSMEIFLNGKQKESRTANFEKGVAHVTFKPTTAEILSLQVKESSQHGLSVPAAVEIKVSPNVPVRLVAEAPQEVRAGENIEVKVIALDAYGNVVHDFKGEIDLQIEAEPLKKIS